MSLWNNLKMFLWMTFLTGLAYPLIITGIAQLMKTQAEGNFLSVDGKKVGSRLIAQKFESDKYFWPRPSAVDYNPLPSGGSNLGPTSTVLKKAVEERKAALAKAHNITGDTQIPSELLFASGSGLDPHISQSTANFQVDRIIKARGWHKDKAKEALKDLLESLTENSILQFIDDPFINVLELNLALDNLDALLKKT